MHDDFFLPAGRYLIVVGGIFRISFLPSAIQWTCLSSLTTVASVLFSVHAGLP